VSWAHPVAGDWTSSANWSPAIVPSNSVNANFRTGSGFAYTVNIQDGSSANNIVVQGDRVGFNLANHSLSAAGNVIVSASDSTPGSLAVTGPGTLSAAGGVVVNSASSASAGASRLTSLQNSRIVGNVTNNGEIRTFNSTSPAEPGNVTTIFGDYTQSGYGTLAMQVRGGAAGLKYDQINVTGTANLAGTLDISVNGFVPAVGDTVTIMNYGAVKGRFDTLKGAVIKDISGQAIAAASYEFFGLLYGADALKLITLRVPQRPNGTALSAQSAPNLILVTHGTNSNAESWVHNLATAMEDHIDVQSGDWDVVAFDWRNYATGSDDPSSSFAPAIAASRGIDIGESLSNWMSENGFDYDYVHSLGHSSGSWLASSFGNTVKANHVHETFFDAFVSNQIRRVGDTDVPQLGSTNSRIFADQYVDGRFLPPGTNATLSRASNIDVTALDQSGSNNPLDWHAWPYIWYLSTTAPRDDEPNFGLGFANTFEGSHHLPLRVVAAGQRLYLPNLNVASVAASQAIDLGETPHIVSDSGTVTFESGGVILTAGVVQNTNADSLVLGRSEDGDLPSGPPTMLTEFITLTQPKDILNFSGQFLAGSDGLLSIYFDGQELIQIDQRLLGTDAFQSGDIWLGREFFPGTYSLLFRLDQYVNNPTSVLISDVSFLGPAVPEPTSLMILVEIMVFSITSATLRFRNTWWTQPTQTPSRAAAANT
jgi:hypothetical protein